MRQHGTSIVLPASIFTSPMNSDILTAAAVSVLNPPVCLPLMFILIRIWNADFLLKKKESKENNAKLR